MEGDEVRKGAMMHNVISIHSLRMEGDLRRHRTYRRMRGFQSTPSAWRETYSYSIYKVHQLFQSTPSAWRETSVSTPAALPSVISIHSLRMEGDVRILK